jgi:hypothetical protein
MAGWYRNRTNNTTVALLNSIGNGLVLALLRSTYSRSTTRTGLCIAACQYPCILEPSLPDFMSRDWPTVQARFMSRRRSRIYGFIMPMYICRLHFVLSRRSTYKRTMLARKSAFPARVAPLRYLVVNDCGMTCNSHQT